MKPILTSQCIREFSVWGRLCNETFQYLLFHTLCISMQLAEVGHICPTVASDHLAARRAVCNGSHQPTVSCLICCYSCSCFQSRGASQQPLHCEVDCRSSRQQKTVLLIMFLAQMKCKSDSLCLT